MTYTYLHALIYKVPTGVTEFTQPLYNLPQFSRMSPSVMCMHTLWHTKQHKEYSGVSRGCASQCQMPKLYLCKIILKKERKVFGFIYLFIFFVFNEWMFKVTTWKGNLCKRMSCSGEFSESSASLSFWSGLLFPQTAICSLVRAENLDCGWETSCLILQSVWVSDLLQDSWTQHLSQKAVS